MFQNKTLLIVGGTGSFGKAMINKIINKKYNFKEIRVFSRDEKKQDDLRKKLNNKKIKFYIGDVRSLSSVDTVMDGVDYVFHAAALKQVPSCEFHPMEAVRTNVLGTDNVLISAEKNKVKRVVCLSTDKAVYPINAMGISKALMEKVVISKSLSKKTKTDFCITRYGNVIGSRGSVIPMLIDQIKKGQAMTITDYKMTRFMMTLSDAIELVIYALKNGKNGQIFIKKTNAASLKTLVDTLKIIFNKKNAKIKIIGTRHGEKLHETLMSREERTKSISKQGYYIINPDVRDLNYDKFFSAGQTKLSKLSDYTSRNTDQLNPIKLKKIIEKSGVL